LKIEEEYGGWVKVIVHHQHQQQQQQQKVQTEMEAEQNHLVMSDGMLLNDKNLS
jgi:hypothetical protein